MSYPKNANHDTEQECENGSEQVTLWMEPTTDTPSKDRSNEIRCMQTLTRSDVRPILIRGDPGGLFKKYQFDGKLWRRTIKSSTIPKPNTDHFIFTSSIATPLFGPNGCHRKTYDDTYNNLPDCSSQEASVPNLESYMASSLNGGVLRQGNGIIAPTENDSPPNPMPQVSTPALGFLSQGNGITPDENTNPSPNPIPQIPTPTLQENIYGLPVSNAHPDNSYTIPAFGKIGNSALTSFLSPANTEMQSVSPNQGATTDEGATRGYGLQGGGYGNIFGTSTRRRRRVVKKA